MQILSLKYLLVVLIKIAMRKKVFKSIFDLKTFLSTFKVLIVFRGIRINEGIFKLR